MVMIYDCELCHKGRAVETIQNCYNKKIGVCVYCYHAVSRSVDKKEENKKVNAKELSIEVSVDTTQIDEAIVKANQLVQWLERADALAYRIGIDMAKSNDMVSVQTYVRGGKDD